MRVSNVPALSWRYWITISLASVFGANLGDFVSHVVHLGHIRGLPVLAALFAGVLLWERRGTAGTMLYYWLAIVILRTGATNTADFATHDMHLPAPWVILGLALLLVLGVASNLRANSGGVPVTNLRYWLVMFIAGTLGTAFGDFMADQLGLGVSTAVFVTVLIIALSAGQSVAARMVGAYWLMICLVRTAGTNVGDFMVDDDGLGLGLWVSTIGMGLMLVAAASLWNTSVRSSLREDPAHP